MRTLLISWEYPPVIEGGLGRHVRKLSEQLVLEGVEIHVLTRPGTVREFVTGLTQLATLVGVAGSG
jgi:hypothetical protein